MEGQITVTSLSVSCTLHNAFLQYPFWSILLSLTAFTVSR